MWHLLFGLLGDLCAAQTANVIWISSPMSSPITAQTMTNHCRLDVSGSFPVLCTATVDATDYFSESFDLFTKGAGGWNTTTPVARAGRIAAALFMAAGLDDTIRDFAGTVTNSQLIHGCKPDGTYMNGMACGGSYAINSGNVLQGPAQELAPVWTGGNSLSVACDSLTNVQFYCAAYISSVTMSPTKAPTVPPTPAPTLAPTTKAPTLAPTLAPTTKAPTLAPTLAPTTKVPTLAPTQAPTTKVPTANPTTKAPTMIPTLAPTTKVPTIAPTTKAPNALPTMNPTTKAPTMAPTMAPTTLAPTSGPAPPSPLPTPASSPTTSAPTTSSPTTSAPTSATPTNAATSAPTTASSVAPTMAMTSAPSQAPTCSGCSVIITPGNSSNTTVTLGPTGGPPVVVTIPPTAIPNCSNCSVVITLTPTPSGPSGGSGVVTVDVVDNGITRPNVSLQLAFTFFMPYSADLVGCSGPVVADCVWRDDTEWVGSGCSSQDVGTGTQCTCTHFTDFAVLLDASAPHPCQSHSNSSEVFFVLIACYAMLFVYCGLAVFRLSHVGAKQSRGVMLLQHGLVGAVCVLRVLSCLNYLGTFGDAMGLSAFVAAAPYPLEYLLFTKFASTWAGLVHFSMLNTEARWKKIRPLFYSINVIGTCLAVGLFVLFYVESSFESALAGTVVLALLYLALAVAFAVYATKLVKELGKASSRSNSKSSSSSTSSISASSKGPSRRKCGVETKIQLIGHLAAVCFVVQALCSVLALALPSEQLVVWTATFCFFNVVALLCILVVYSAAVLKAPKTASRTYTDPSASAEMQVLK